MKGIFLPAIWWMNRLPYRIKLPLIGFIFLIPIAVVLYLLYQEIDANVKFAKKEQIGVLYLAEAKELFKATLSHWELADAVTSGNNDFRDEMETTQTKLKKSMEAIDDFDKKYGALVDSTQRWTKVKKRLEEIMAGARAGTLAESSLEHYKLFNDEIALLVHVADKSNLTLDPEADSYYLQNTMIHNLPRIAELVAELEGHAIHAAEVKTLSADDKTDLIVLENELASEVRNFGNSIASLREYAPQTMERLNKDVQAMEASLASYIEILDNKLIKAEQIDLDVNTYLRATEATEASIAKLFDAMLPELSLALQKRIDRYKTKEYIAVGSIGVFALLAVYLFTGLYFAVVGSTTALQDAALRVSAGDLKTRVDIEARDELAPVASALDKMVQELDTMLTNAREQNQRNQEAILRLLDDIGGLADGDLTTRATVSEDFTGAIADALNYTIDALRDLIVKINVTSDGVSSAAHDTRDIAARLSEAAELQVKEIKEAGTTIGAMSSSAVRVSSNAVASNEVAQQSVSLAKKGSQAVQSTIQGMESIREQIQETSKRIKRLGESSQEIGEIVELINDIADQTNILALNASIQAATAGEAGRGFVVVADEVQRLAERVANSTKQIEGLVKTIQTDTNEAVISMEKSTSGVVTGTKLAQDAGKSLGEIEQVSSDLARLIEGIAEAARQQTQAASVVTETMTVIQDIAGQTSEESEKTASSISKLAEMSSALKQSVSGFKLPA